MPKGHSEVLSLRDVKDIIELAKVKDPFDYLLFTILARTGRRIGELYGVEFHQKRCNKCGWEGYGYKSQSVCKACKNSIKDKKERMAYKEVTLSRIPGTKATWRYGVQVRHIDFENNEMETYILKRENRRTRITLLNKPTMDLLRQYILVNRLGPHDYIFRKKSYRTIERVLKRYLKELGIYKNATIHSFRHFFITHLRAKGWPDDQIVLLTGHSRTDSLKTYDHSDPRRIKKKALEVIDEI